jgi:hypothetical protein
MMISLLKEDHLLIKTAALDLRKISIDVLMGHPMQAQEAVLTTRERRDHHGILMQML